MSTKSNSKKRKATNSKESPAAKKSTASDALDIENGFEPFTLESIRTKIQSLSTRVPKIPEEQFADFDNLEEKVVREWAAQLQAVLEEFNVYFHHCFFTIAWNDSKSD